METETKSQEVVYLRAGDVLSGKFRLIKPLGKGGEGSVWLALHIQTVQLWALKAIQKTGKGEELHEIRMMKKLRYPSVPQIMDVLEDADSIYIVMEYVRGRTLQAELAEKGRLPLEEVMETAIQISAALCYLHGQKIPVLHLDIKPANIIRKKDGRLVLVDFGAAKREIYGENDKKRMGTGGYAAPEQYDLKQPVDARTDIYGLGATLYHLISGKQFRPFLHRSKVPGCPDYLAKILKKCLQADMQQRWENSKKLNRSFLKAGKQYRFQKMRVRFWTALLLVVGALGLAARGIAGEFSHAVRLEWNYDRLLEEALRTDRKEGQDLYLRAVFLKPSGREAYLQYLQQADSDAVFDAEEETFLRKMLYSIPSGGNETYEELLRKEPEAFGAFASELGLIYWYDYGEPNGRKIAAGWFQKAVNAADETDYSEEEEPQWMIRARIYAHMGSYLERLGSYDESGERENSVFVYWKEAGRLLEAGAEEGASPITRLRFYLETVERIGFLAKDLKETGITCAQMRQMVETISRRAENIEAEEGYRDMKEELQKKIDAGMQTTLEILTHLEEVSDEK